MNAKRKKTEEFILKYIKKITGTDFNVNLYKDLFKSMSDKEFDIFMKDLKDNNKILQVIVPHEKEATNITVENNIKLGKELGYDFFQHLIMEEPDQPKRKTKYKFLVYPLTFRRTKQLVDKGVSVSENDKQRDLSTGQVTGDSRSSKLSLPEAQLLIGMNNKATLDEFLQSRGGDEGEEQVMKKALLKYGKVSKKFLEEYSTGTRSTKTLKVYFRSMHLEISL